jgi:hypothetical protein
VVASGFSSPWGIAVDGSGNVYVGAFGGPGGGPAGLYKIPAGGSPTLITSQYGVFTSLAVDANGDIWGAAGSDNLVLIPAGSTTGTLVGIPGVYQVNGVRLDSDNNLYASTASGDSAVKVPVGWGTPVVYSPGGGYTEGVAVDASGDVFVGTPSGTPLYGKVYEIVPGGGQTVYAGGYLANTGGLALYPPMSPASRSSSSVSLSTPTTSTDTLTPVTPTASVTSGGSGGSVQFNDNGTSLGNPVAVSGGVAQYTGTLPAGTNDITATFLGDSTDAPAMSNTVAVNATAIATTTTISTSSGSVIGGTGQATVTASVTAASGTPSGTVDFYVNGVDVTSATLTGGQATANVSLPAWASYVKATYDGNSTFATSTSAKIKFTSAAPYPSSISSFTNYGPANLSGAVVAKMTVIVTGVAGRPQPTGMVTADDGFTCGNLTAIPNSPKSWEMCTHQIPLGASETVDLSYAGDGQYVSASGSSDVSNAGVCVAGPELSAPADGLSPFGWGC